MAAGKTGAVLNTVEAQIIIIRPNLVVVSDFTEITNPKPAVTEKAGVASVTAVNSDSVGSVWNAVEASGINTEILDSVEAPVWSNLS